jgi:hypothetical protein
MNGDLSGYRMERLQPSIRKPRFVLLFESLGSLGVQRRRLRYQDLVRDPCSAIARVVPNSRPEALAFIRDGRAQLRIDHQSGGTR